MFSQRDEAWDIFPFACLGQFWFLLFGLARHPAYPRVLELLTEPPVPSAADAAAEPRYLDLGTCLGQDLRRLHHAGVPARRLHGCDVFAAFERCGHALFRDADRLAPGAHFIVGDLLTDVERPATALGATAGTWAVVGLFMFLHLFDLADQERACAAALRLLRRDGPALVVGAQTGTVAPGEMTLRPPFCREGEHRTAYRHSTDTMVAMWERVGEAVGLWVKVEAAYDEAEMRERAEGVARDPHWEKKHRSLVGADNRRVFFLVEVTGTRA